MSIEYTYEIVSVDKGARCMEVAYSSPGRQTIHVNVRLPAVGESLVAVVNMFSPVDLWKEQEAEFSTLAIDDFGTINTHAHSMDAIAVIQEAETISTVDFWGRFTQKEQLEIVTASLTNVVIQEWREWLTAESRVNPRCSKFIVGLETLVQKKLLTRNRADDIMGRGQIASVITL